MMKIYFVLFSLLSLMMLPNTTWASMSLDCPVYQFECLPEVNQVRIQAHTMDCYGDEGVIGFEKPKLDAMAQKGLFSPLENYGTETDPYINTHECTINGRTVKIEMDFIYLSMEEHGIICAETHGYFLRTNWWLDGTKVVDDVAFKGGCDSAPDGPLYPGNYMMSLMAHIYEKNKRHLNIKALVYEGNFETKVRKFRIEAQPPYKPLEELTHLEILKIRNIKAPLKHIHIHDEEFLLK